MCETGESEIRWFVLRLKHQHDKIAAEVLAAKGFQLFWPTYQVERRWSDRKKLITLPLLPGYIFLANDIDRRLAILSTPGVCGLLTVDGQPAVVSQDDVGAIQAAVTCRVPVEPYPFLKEGDRVRVLRGPLAGYEGFLLRWHGTARLVIYHHCTIP